MCGIAGIIGSNRAYISQMLDVMKHRGPDAVGQLELQELTCIIGHVRLSIIDLDPRSNQPFVSSCGRYALVYNGEIYNYLELHKTLEKIGHTFHTKSDTEVLLHWLIEYGTKGIPDLEGMFAFCFVDRNAQTLLLARDQIGEKPLYYSVGKETGAPSFAFASEIKALLAIPGIDTSLDEEGLADYLRFLYTAAPNTLYRGIRELPPGHYIEVDVNKPKDITRQYFNLESSLSEYLHITYDEAVKTFHDLFMESVKLRLRSDVPLSIYLSGGLDSNIILGAAKKIYPDIQLETFTIRYDGSSLARSFDESRLAARAANEKGVSNNQILFTENDQFVATVERVVDLFDQPFGNATAIVADKMAAGVSKVCKVALVGDGGDEVLVGYPRYKALPLYEQLQDIPLVLKRLIISGTSYLPECGRLSTKLRRLKQFTRGLNKPLSESFLNWSTYLDSETLIEALGIKTQTTFYSGLLNTFERYKNDPVRAAAIVDIKSFVPFNLMQSADRTSMAHSLELRCPFLSPKVIRFALNIHTNYKLVRGRNKPMLLDAFPNTIPDFIANQPKRAFNPPVQGFIRRNLPLLDNYLRGPGSLLSDIVAKSFLMKEINAFHSGRRDNSTFLWGLATLECWLRRQRVT